MHRRVARFLLPSPSYLLAKLRRALDNVVSNACTTTTTKSTCLRQASHVHPFNAQTWSFSCNGTHPWYLLTENIFFFWVELPTSSKFPFSEEEGLKKEKKKVENRINKSLYGSKQSGACVHARFS